ncbi:MAG: hypothetical protein ABJE95_07910 [Byssovorax sp.]
MRKLPTAKSSHEKALLGGLADAVHGITSPFVCAGSLVLDQPVSLRFPDGGTFTVVPASRPYDQDTANEALKQRCVPAAFGKGRKTRHDRSVRDALQLNAAGEAFSVLHFDPASSGLLEKIRRTLAPTDSNPITAELYAVNIYSSDGHFQPHKDTPRGDDMLGSLVVCLPSHFAAGQFVVSHRGSFKVFHWGREIEQQPEPNRVHWAAFFGDVDHAVERVHYGSRVTLTYLLRRGIGAVREEPKATDEPIESERLAQLLRAALSDPKLLPKGGVLGFPCFHMYSQDLRFQKKITPINQTSMLTLKGRDQAVAQVASSLGLSVTLRPYLVETCADQTWELKHFPTPAHRAKLGDRMDYSDLEDTLPVASEAMYPSDLAVAWVVPPPQFNRSPHLYGRDDKGQERPVNPDSPALEYLHECEYSSTGYFGNEAGDTEFYVYAALLVEIPPLGEGARGEPTKQAAKKTPKARSVSR